MIITVTMNPAIDKTIDVEQLVQGGLNRAMHVESDVGGKGINVSKTIAELGGKSIATGFIAGNSGRTIQRVLSDNGIENDFIEVAGETRTNTKIVEKTGEVTELNEPGPKIEEKDVKALLRKLEDYAGPDTLFVLSGSIPQGLDKGIYCQIIDLVHRKGAKVLLDADGEPFARGLQAVPDIIKPNKEELERYVEKHVEKHVETYKKEYIPAQTHVMDMAGTLLEKGVETVVVSMGKDGAVFLKKDCIIRCSGLKVKAHSTVGAGDAMVAALAYGWDKKIAFEETVKMSMAASAGAVMTVGTKPPSKEVVKSLIGQVMLAEVERNTKK